MPAGQFAQEYKERLKGIKKGSSRLNAIVDELLISPVVRISGLEGKYGITYPTAKADVDKLAGIGILHELEGVYPTTFFAPEVLNITYKDL